MGTEKPFAINRVGHVAIAVTDMDRAIDWYTNTLGMTFTGRWTVGPGVELGYLRFGDDHHNVALFTHPGAVHSAFEVANRDEWLKALAHFQRKGVKTDVNDGPTLHGPEGSDGDFGGSGSRSFYVKDPDGNVIELYTEMMKVPNGEPFPRKDYEDLDMLKPS